MRRGRTDTLDGISTLSGNQWLPMVTNHDDVDNDGGDVGDDDDDTVDDDVQ